MNEVSTIMEKVTKLEEIVANLEMENNELKVKLEELETNKKDQIETESRLNPSKGLAGSPPPTHPPLKKLQ